MLTITNATKTFVIDAYTQIKALDNVSLTLGDNDFVILIGSNGSGKTTLFNAITGEITLDKGSIFQDKENIAYLSTVKRSKKIAKIAQNPLAGTVAELSIVQNFRLAYLKNKKLGLNIAITSNFRQKVKEKVALLNMGLEDKIDQEMGKLSGGQRQALSLLMHTWHKPELLLLDEPTAALDAAAADTVMKIVQRIVQEYQIPCMLITHNIPDMIQYGNRLVQMHKGKIVRDLSLEEKSNLKPEIILKWLSLPEND
ncbi:MAG: ATP-binding cassette domain-containing protein [Bacteroidia bacterium]|nr:ATP-binding cassette domain-containing protein [Bacteroidia bacterium]MDW8301770.1 ATP-binding cassette domain-containing protein [Bacteroidia bacterium]